ncbi:MAG: MFS transporter [Clostridia bacterium]|nr:MFS transporter [Clostridia bacterium]
MNKDTRNYILMFFDPVTYVAAMVFISINAVIPNFLNELGASAFQISFASALCGIGPFLSQPLFAQTAMGKPLKSISFARILYVQRFLFLLYVLFISLINRYFPSLSVTAFLTFWGIFNIFVGCYSPFFMSVISKVIPGNQRGRLSGFANAAGNILALGSAFLIGVILKKFLFPFNYTLIFGIGTLLLILNAMTFALIEEEPDETKKKAINYFKYIREIPHALRTNKGYAATVMGNSFLVISNVALAFYTLAAIRNFDAGPEQIALFTGIGVLVNIFGSMVFGVIGDWAGHRYVLLISAFFSALASVLVSSIHSLITIYIGFALSSLSTGGYMLSGGMNIINHSPKEQLPLYVSMNTMITLTASSTVTLLAGAIIDTFSFTPLFVFTALCGVISTLVFYGSDKTKDIVRSNSEDQLLS